MYLISQNYFLLFVSMRASLHLSNEEAFVKYIMFVCGGGGGGNMASIVGCYMWWGSLDKCDNKEINVGLPKYSIRCSVSFCVDSSVFPCMKNQPLMYQ